MSSYNTLSESNIIGKTVLLRAGFDLPIEEGRVLDTTRVEAVLPTIKFILDAGCPLIIMAHQGRPKGKVVEAMSQKPIVKVLEDLLDVPVHFAESCTGSQTKDIADKLQPGHILLLENLRFDSRERSNDPSFAKELADLADVYVNDAFTNSHRNHASMVGVAKLLPASMGLHLQKEVEHLVKVVESPEHPLTLIVSGAKMETKVPVIEHFLNKGDDVLVGGCIANTFIAARGFDMGSSKYEAQFIDTAQEIMLESEMEDKAMVHVPRDVVLATSPAEDAEKINLPVEDIEGDMSAFDIGKVSIERYKEVIDNSKMIVWCGPLGLYEYNRFSHATKRIAEAVSEATKRGATTIIGGGDTLDFHHRYSYPLDAYTFASTGGGAMLDFIAGKKLPGLKVLESKKVLASA